MMWPAVMLTVLADCGASQSCAASTGSEFNTLFLSVCLNLHNTSG